MALRLLRLGTIFYLGYLIFEYPQNLALQRFPVGKWMRFVVTPIQSNNRSHVPYS